MIRLIGVLLLLSLSFPDAYAWSCNNYDIIPGTDVYGCLPSATDIARWEAHEGAIAALQARVTALEGGSSGEPPGPGTFPDIFQMTPEQGAIVASACLSVLGLAFVFRMLIKVLNEG